MYEAATEFCQNELNLRKAAAEAKTVQSHAQVQAQVQTQIHQQALQVGAMKISLSAVLDFVAFILSFALELILIDMLLCVGNTSIVQIFLF